MKPVLGVAIAVAIIAAAVIIGTQAGGRRPRGQTVDYPARVVSMCQEAVKEQLKAPATATFPTAETPVIDAAVNLWRYTASLDAENSFGANIRSRFNCTVTPDFASARAELF